MGKSLSKSIKSKSHTSSSVDQKSAGKKNKSSDVSNTNESSKKKNEVKPPKFAVNKPKNDKFDRDLKRASKKRKKSTKERLDNMKPLPPPSVPPKVLCEQDYDEMAIVKIKNLLSRDSDLFLLNQLLLSVQFYTNFER